MKEKIPVIFTHIPKTAGYTMHTILHRQYVFDMRNIFTSDNIGKINKFSALPEKFRRHLAIVKGHLYYGVHNYIPSPVRYFTMLRDPVKRAISLYNYLLVEPSTPYYKEIQKHQYTLEQLLENGYILNMDNCQVRYLCGVTGIPFGSVNEEHLQMAIDNLTNHYESVGISEHFDESVLLFAKKFNWSKPWYNEHNVGKNPSLTLSELSPETLEKLKYFNRYDEILYRKALELFQKEMADAGPSFKDEVAAFKKENKRRGSVTNFITRFVLLFFLFRHYTGTHNM